MVDFSNHVDFCRLFDLSTSWEEVHMVHFTKYIDFFRLLKLLGGCINSRFY